MWAINVYQLWAEISHGADYMPLTNNEILQAKPLEKDFMLHNGDGLFLLIKTSGKKLWRFRYQRPKVEAARILVLAHTLP